MEKKDDKASRSGSGSTVSSSGSSISSAAARARAKAEAALARASFAEKELVIKKEKARLEAEKAGVEATLAALHLEQEAAAAVAHAEILEAAVGEEDGDRRSQRGSHSSQAKRHRIESYVKEQREWHTIDAISVPPGQTCDNEEQPPPSVKHEDIQVTHSHNGDGNLHSTANKQVYRGATRTSNKYVHSPSSYQPIKSPPRRMSIAGESPLLHQRVNPNHPSNQKHYAHQPEATSMIDFAKYLAKRELVTTGLTKFDDRPESFRAWQSSFTNAIHGLDLTASEELDLLVRWLGKESAEQVRRIRSVHVTDPYAACQLAWERLLETYAAPEVIECALFKKLDNFPRITSKDGIKLRELGDLLMELQSAKEDGYLPGLAYLDTARGIITIVEKLPHALQEKWVSLGSKFKEENGACFPPFSFFAQFICKEAKTRNDPSFFLSSNASGPIKHEKSSHRQTSEFKNSRTPIYVHKTNIATTSTTDTGTDKVTYSNDLTKTCPIHNKPHPLAKCRAFRAKPLEERKNYLKENSICFRCCASSSHLARDCKKVLQCGVCGSNNHSLAMHPGPAIWGTNTPIRKAELTAQEEEGLHSPTTVTSRCTEVCGPGLSVRSCSKICLVKVYPHGQPERAIKVYTILDEQSNRSLAKSKFFEQFGIKSGPFPYSMKTCAGVMEMAGRKAHGFQIEAVNGGIVIDLPTLIECDEIPDNRKEIPTPEAAQQHCHLRPVADYIPELDPNAEILLLLGRDILRVHKVRQHVNGPGNTPFAQRLDLGWVLIGDVCLGNVHKPSINTFKTHILENGRPSFFTPCQSQIYVKETVGHGGESVSCTMFPPATKLPDMTLEDKLGSSVFMQTRNDDKIAPSIEDEAFLKIMEKECHKDNANSWVAPLPFRESRHPLPNNRDQALSRLASLRRTLEKKPVMKEQFINFMGKVLENNHAEVAPPLKDGEECWYLPTFGVYHPQKPDQIRVVFDSSAQHGGTSLNQVLLTGPDLNNSLLGVLMRFRKEPVAITADIQQMFYCFLVKEDHRNYLRFLWYRDNDMSKDIVEYRMRVHVFGNSPSPAIAIYGLRCAAQDGLNKYGTDTYQFVVRHFYMDDGLISLPTESKAIDLLKRTQASLAQCNLKLHKIASNSTAVMRAFPAEELAKGIKDLSLADDTLPVQRSLGLLWDMESDTFTFDVSVKEKPFTRRGVLATVNGLFDPLGLVAPVTIRGRVLLRECCMDSCDWDTPLPLEKREKWETWRTSLQDLKNLQIPRTYTPHSLLRARHTELCLFSDASNTAIGAVAYLRVAAEDGKCKVGFVLGKAKLTPQPTPTTPRLELCAAVLAVEMADLILDEIDLKPDAVKFYCDSKVVLGYIFNESRRFFVYVHNRVRRIRQTTRLEQWHYVTTDQNPADLATRSVTASQLSSTAWFTGPAFLQKPLEFSPIIQESFQLVDPDLDSEIRPQITSLISQTSQRQLCSQRFQRFSTWESLHRAVALLVHVARSFKTGSTSGSAKCKGWHWCDTPRTPEEWSAAKNIIIRSAQNDTYADEINALAANKELLPSSPLVKLDPIIQDGLLKVGGRLRHAPLDQVEKNPLILGKQNHVTKLLVQKHHKEVKHQGRQFTEGAIRAAGLWIVGSKRLISSVLHECITCRKLRGRMEKQKMADLPPERLSISPPFSYVGLDVFGPWTIVTRRTRGGAAHSKRWAILFTCMSTRAVHIEVIESMDTSSCINALRRFFAIRGPAQQLRSDCGTNFIGASGELKMDKDASEQSAIQKYLSQQGCTWKFNPPHASHMGGAWERLIGVSRRILDSMLLERKSLHLTHEVLCTLMAEVSAIINARPLVPVSSDPDSPFLLTPAILLTQKSGLSAPPGPFSEKDLYKSQWRQVQALADEFWSRWRSEYLPTLQSRRKWTETCRDLQIGDIVLLKDCQLSRNEWPMALVTSVFQSSDGKVRRIEVRINSQGTSKTYVRPVSEVILLLPKKTEP